MSDIGKNALKTKIDAKIYDNESQLISGTILNEVLQDAVDEVFLVVLEGYDDFLDVVFVDKAVQVVGGAEEGHHVG